MTRYRIAMVAACPFPCQRGTPVRIHRTAEALLGRGHEVHVVTYHLAEPVPMHDDLRVHRIRSVPTYRRMSPGPTPQKVLLVDVLLARKLRRLLREQQFDVVHAHHVEGLLAALWGRRRGSGPPVIFDAHTLLHSELPYYAPAPLKWIARAFGGLVDRRLPPRADATIAVTDEIRDALIEMGVVAPQRCTTIGNGVEHELFDGLSPRSRTPEDECIIVFTGNLAPYQGIEPMLHAFATLRRRGVRARLRIVSQASMEAYEGLLRRLDLDDAIELVDEGFEAVPALLAASDIAVNPRIEAPGLPQKTMNYMAAGMPIVSFAGSGRYLEDGKTALLVPDGDTSAFADAIQRLVEDPAEARRLGDAARAMVLSQMSWDHSAALVEAVYAAVLSRAASR